MKKVLAILLSIVMIASICMLTGCSDESAKFVGTWEAEIDITDALNQMAAETEGMEDLVVNDVTLKMQFIFNEDGTYTAGSTEEYINEFVDNYIAQIEDYLIEMLEKEIESSGLDMTVDEVLALSGTSLDALIEEMKAGVDAEEMIGDMESQGEYKAMAGKLYMSDKEITLVDCIDSEIYTTYEFDGDTLTFIDEIGTEDVESDEMSELILDDMFPLTLTRVE